MLWNELRGWLDGALAAWAPALGLDSVPAYALEEPPAGIDADVACNIALLLAKSLKRSPRALAQDLQNTLQSGLPSFVEAISIAGAGFLNFHWSSAALQNEMRSVVEQKDAYGRGSGGEKVLIEFVSANPTGPLHVGHGRGAALGDSLALILRHLGHQVSREYYINDAGNQVQLLSESVRARCLELSGKPFELPAEGYHGDYIKDVAKAYLAVHPNAVDDRAKITRFALDWMIQWIAKDLDDFGLKFDSWFSEASVVQTGLVDKHVEALRSRGFVQDSDGAVWFIAQKLSSPADGSRGSMVSSNVDSPLTSAGNDIPADKDRVLKRKDGRWTYFATDIAYHADKFERGFTQLIDIWGADHHGYVSRVKGSLQALGYDANKLHIVLYQLVSLSRGGVPVSMSKRSGDFITMREVLDEVGRDACRFFFALRGPNTALEFDLELAKKHTDENPVYYLQYAHARICSIFRNAEEGHAHKEHLLPSPAGRQAGSALPAPHSVDWSLLKEKDERELMKRIIAFPDTLKTCAGLDSPHPLATYLLSLCRQFHFFYDHHRVLGVEAELTGARLGLLEAVRQILRLGLKLLGVSAPESL